MGYVDSSVVKGIVSVSWPLMVQYLCESLYAFVDMYFVAGLGLDAVSAVGAASYVISLTLVPFMALRVGLTVYVAQCYGAGRPDLIRRSFCEVTLLALLLSAPVCLLMILCGESIAKLITPSDAVSRLSYEYIKAFSLSYPGIAVFTTYTALLNGIKLTRYGMAMGVLSDVINIAIDPPLIYGCSAVPGLGVTGAALATAISVYSSLPLGHYFSHKALRHGLLRPYAFSRDVSGKVVSIGIPFAAERFAMFFLYAVYGAIVARYGDRAFAAYQIGLRIEGFLYLPMIAIASASSIMVGYEVGRGDLRRGYRISWTLVWLSVVFTLIAAVPVIIAGKHVAQLFTHDPEVIELAYLYLVLACTSDLLLAASFAVSGAFRGIGDPRTPLVINLSSMTLFRIIPSSVALIHELSLIYVWMMMFIEVVLRGVIHMAALKKLYYARATRLVS